MWISCLYCEVWGIPDPRPHPKLSGIKLIDILIDDPMWLSNFLVLVCTNSDDNAWWRHQMETFSALLAICAGNSPVPGEFPTQRPVTRSFDVYFDMRPNKRLSKQSLGWWFVTLSHPFWRHRDGLKFTPLLKRTGSHSDYYVATGCTWSGHGHHFRYNQWQ